MIQSSLIQSVIIRKSITLIRIFAIHTGFIALKTIPY